MILSALRKDLVERAKVKEDITLHFFSLLPNPSLREITANVKRESERRTAESQEDLCIQNHVDPAKPFQSS